MFSNTRDKFLHSKITKNHFYSNQDEYSKEYIFYQEDKENIERSSIKKQAIGKNQSITKPIEQEVHNLQDLWNNIDLDDMQQDNVNVKNHKMSSVPVEIHQQHQEKLQKIQQKSNNNTQIINLQNQQAQNFEDLWNQIKLDDQQNQQNKQSGETNTDQPLNDHSVIPKNQQNQSNVKNQCQLIQPSKQNQEIIIKPKNKLQIIQEMNNKIIQNYTNLNLQKDFLIYDYQAYFLNFYTNSIFSYFGFYQSPTKKHNYFLYNLATEENIIECYLDAFRDIDKLNQDKKASYQNHQCFRFKVVQTGQLIATAYFKYVNNGVMYNVKPFNFYQNSHHDTMSLIQVSDGYLANNCYCDTSVYVSQKYHPQPGQFKMSIGFKNGYLIANMGVNGVKSAPYNCRLQNQANKSFSFLLGLIDKEKHDFLIRIGEGMCPLLGMAVSVGRKKYIDSFQD